ncbi:MAG: DegT/DnrJ/EryC1/StrS family aminotransferase [Planctomycetota bacterium]
MSQAATAQKPAILGGLPAVTLDGSEANRWPIITDEDVDAVTEVLRSGKLSINEINYALEDDYRQFLGVKNALAYCNATSGLFAALHGFGLQPGDEVLVPSATYWASVMPVLWCGAVPIFCESEDAQIGIDPEDAARKITDKTKAMVAVHLWGMPSRMDELLALAQKHNLKVLEDASHAHGARYHGKYAGTLGDAAVFSLQTEKLAPAGEGGILATDDDGLYEHVQCLGHFERVIRMETPARRFAGTGFGLKHRMAPLSAAVARTQLRHLEARNRRRNENLEYLSRRLETLGIKTFMAPEGIDRVYFMYILDNDEARTGLPTPLLVKALQAEGCQTLQPRYPLLHQQPVFTEDKFIEIARLQHLSRDTLPVYKPDALPFTQAGQARMFQLPNFPQAEKDLLDQYATAFEKVIGSAAQIAALPK